jgi:acetylornithine/N-succinyldiaminopimelate aminotransferase
MSNYAPLPVTFEKGDGAWLWDMEGKRYLDAVSGVAVCSLGHSHPAVTQAMCEQAGQLIHTSNLYGIAHQRALGDKLTALAGMDKAFFCNSGAEANEAAIKLARLHARKKGVQQPAIVVTEGSFHGRTLATLSATGSRKVQAGFEPLVGGFLRVSYNDLEAIENIAKHNPNVVAVLVEPVQGEGGVNIPDTQYLSGIRTLCDQHDWLMMLDEIQTGMGRTGKWFGHQHAGCIPDVMTLAKALGNGFPVGACLAKGDAAELFQPGSHGSTFGGNPLACRVGLTVIDTLEKENLITRAADLSESILGALRQRLSGLPHVVDIRGQGLLMGIELSGPCGALVQQALDKGLLINVTAERVVRLLPPLILSDEQAQELVDTLASLIESFAPEG